MTRAYELSANQYICDDGVLHLVTFVQTVGHSTLIVFANNWAIAGDCDRKVQIATTEDVTAAERNARETGRGLVNFPDLPGPVSREFGPMYADPVSSPGCERCGAFVQVPFGIGLCADCAPVLPLEPAEKPERSGWAPPSGHAAVLPPDALKHDGRYDDNGEG